MKLSNEDSILEPQNDFNVISDLENIEIQAENMDLSQSYIKTNDRTTDYSNKKTLNKNHKINKKIKNNENKSVKEKNTKNKEIKNVDFSKFKKFEKKKVKTNHQKLLSININFKNNNLNSLPNSPSKYNKNKVFLKNKLKKLNSKGSLDNKLKKKVKINKIQNKFKNISSKENKINSDKIIEFDNLKDLVNINEEISKLLKTNILDNTKINKIKNLLVEIKSELAN